MVINHGLITGYLFRLMLIVASRHFSSTLETGAESTGNASFFSEHVLFESGPKHKLN
jgi:hypothetical protein